MKNETTAQASTMTTTQPARQIVPFWQKLAYGLGGPVEITAVWIPMNLLTQVFNIGLGMNPALLGLILALWRGWDAFADLFTGNYSDNAKTRWGRRKPFIVLGAILTGLTMPLIWWIPTGMTQWQMFAWLLIAGGIFYSCFSIWAMPFYSLQMEMSPDYDERTNITAYLAFVKQIFSLGASWVLAAAALPMFSKLPNQAPDLPGGMRVICLALAALTIIFGVLPGLFVRERYAQMARKKQPFWPSLKQTISTRPFLLLIAIVITYTFGFGLVQSLGFYVNAYYVCRGDLALATKIQGVAGTLLFAPNLLMIPFATWLSSRFGKRALLYLAAGSGILGSLSVFVFYTPEHPWWQLIPPLLISPVTIALWLVVPAMQADIADYDELATGHRREGSFSSVFSWVLKASNTLTFGIGGLVLVWTGFNIEHGSRQPAEVLNNLRLFYVFIPAVFLVCCILIIGLYKLDRKKMQEIRAELETRRGVI